MWRSVMSMSVSGVCFGGRVWRGVWWWFHVRCFSMVSVVNCGTAALGVFWCVVERVRRMVCVCLWVRELPLIPVVYCVLRCVVCGAVCNLQSANYSQKDISE